jgi:hypothetical protein
MQNDRPTNLGDIDTSQIDVATDPKSKRARRRKVQRMPALLEPWAEKAKARMEKRPASPGIMLEPGAGYDEFVPVSPHDNDEVWQLQIHDAFGTRSPATVRVFIEQLRLLCGQVWDDDRKAWRPSETEISAAVNLVSGIQPRNEIEAALAAQMVAIHFMMMRMSAQALNTSDTRTASVAGKLARTYAAQMDTLQRGRGKSRSTRQHITVRHEKHIHTHQHQHVAFLEAPKTPETPVAAAWGCASPEPIPPALPGEHDAPAIEQRTGPVRNGATVPSQEQVGEVVPLRRRAGKAGV